MTTLEAVSFYAGIILPPETSMKTKKARINRVLALMGIIHAKDTIVSTLAVPCRLEWGLYPGVGSSKAYLHAAKAVAHAVLPLTMLFES